jgi:hypothetical protein
MSQETHSRHIQSTYESTVEELIAQLYRDVLAKAPMTQESFEALIESGSSMAMQHLMAQFHSHKSENEWRGLLRKDLAQTIQSLDTINAYETVSFLSISIDRYLHETFSVCVCVCIGLSLTIRYVHGFHRMKGVTVVL